MDCSECDRPARARGFCNKHYLRFSRHGSARAGGRERNGFESHIVTTEHGLEWRGTVNKIRNLTYGRYNHEYAHRLAYEKWVGPIPEGDYVVDHQPDCPKLCVTPEHLTLYLRGEHTSVGIERGEVPVWGTWPRGRHHEHTS